MFEVLSLVFALTGPAPAVPAAAQDAACPYRASPALDRRPSPLDSLTFPVSGQAVKICYGRPSARGRTMIGGAAVPFGTVWRTGANETTKLITPVPLSVGGIEVPAGMFALFAVPGAGEWEIIVNPSHEQWGRENNYTEEVRKQELGRAQATVERVADAIETFTIRAEPQPDGSAMLVLEWEQTRVRVRIEARHM
jgi:hypothetical protein